MSIAFIMNMTLLSPYVTLDANYANPPSSRKLGHSSFQEMYLFLTFFDRK
jgi:hypothetical protein